MKDEILKILAEAGREGLRVRKIILHVYNSQNSLFQAVSLEEVKRRVLAFLQQNSRHSHDLLDHPSWGVYRLNPKSKRARNIQLTLHDIEADASYETRPTPEAPAGPTLFDDCN